MIKNPMVRKIILVLALKMCFFEGNSQGPISPEAGTFEPIDASDMVNLITGDLSYVLPLLEVPSPEGGYPITLNYHAGISLDQDASWTGLGWNINPGAINRNVSGVPDDWNDALSSSISRSVGGTVRNTQIFAGVGWGDDDSNSIGLHANIQSHKAFGGETTYNYTIGVQAKLGDHSFGANYSNNGSWGVNYSGLNYNSNSGLGVTLSLPVMENGLYANLSYSAKTGLGVSLSSPGLTPLNDVSVNLVGSSGANSGTSSSATSMDFGDMFSINLNFGFFKIGIKTQEYDYWHFDEKTYGSTGALYAGKLSNTLENKVLPRFHAFDASQSLNEFDRAIEGSLNNPTYINYDKYDVNAQGINGSISPYLFNTGFLHLPSSYYVRRKTNLYGKNTELVHQFYDIPDLYKNSLSSSIDQNNGVAFYFKNRYASYIRFKPEDNVSWTNDNHNRQGKILQSIRVGQESTEYQGYNSTKNRLQRGSYIQTFTNKQLKDIPFYNNGIDRRKFDENGIGAFKITKADGLTYHYALPVYQKEKISRVTQYKENINNKYTEEQSLTPYATHWLLTAITGPDYIDKNADNELDSNDYGYWVKFDYGKWSDGFGWRVPKRGYHYGENSKSFSWGLKEVYYLNSIKTRTHTALFIKEDRVDGKSNVSNHYNSTRTNLRNYNARYNTLDQNLPVYGGADGKTYYPGVYSLQSPDDLASYWTTYSIINIDNGMYAQSFAQKSQKLSKIILLKNEDVPVNLSTHTDGHPASKKASDIFFREKTIIVNDGPGSKDYNSGWVPYVNSTYYGEYYHKIYDVKDSYYNLEERAVKIVSFDYDYSLAKQYDNIGRLSLKSVNIKGKGGVNVIPPYDFQYKQNTLRFNNNDNKNSWGHYKTIPSLWSLNKIKTPVGGEINIHYEPDDYSSEAALSRIFFDKNIRVKFEKNNFGEKFVRFSNSTGNDSRQNINFENYFKEGRKEYIDLLYWQNDYIVDVAAECEVTYVSSNHLYFKLPNLSNKSDVRKNYNCSKKSWFFVKNFDGAINKTINWKDEINETLCDSKGERIKIRITSSYQKQNTKGGGIRVKKIDVDNKYYTNYFYSKKGMFYATSSNYKSSGVTSFSPSKQFKEIPFKDYVSSPVVMYENVSVQKEDGTVRKFNFNVLKPFTIQGNTYKLGDFLSVTKTTPIMENIPRVPINDYRFYPGYMLNKQNFKIKSNFESLGTLMSSEVINVKGQVLSKITNNYKLLDDGSKGVIQENYSNVERITGYDGQNHGVAINIGNTTKLNYPSVIESITQSSGGITSTRYFDKFDIITGSPLEIKTQDSKGTKVKTEIVPAFHKYSQMGPKSDNNSYYKNMLSQVAEQHYYIFKNDEWKRMGSTVTTWKNNWLYPFDGGGVENSSDVWRKHKTFVWNGKITDGGIYDGFTNYLHREGALNTNWLEISEVKKYNQYSQPLEVKDINGNYASTKMGDTNTKIIATASAAYHEIYYSGVENLGGVSAAYPNQGGVFLVDIEEGADFAKSRRTTIKAHTGKTSLKVDNIVDCFHVKLKKYEHRTGKYKLSVWIDKGNENKARVSIKGNSVEFNGEMIYVGDWVLLNHYIDLKEDGDYTIGIRSTGDEIYADDFRLQPVYSSMLTYVYNEWDEVKYIMGANGLSTFYVYDNAGRLIESKQEIIDKVQGDGSGGFKKVMTNSYNYKKNN
ncbi:hypothetical protein [Tenacibaculum sp. M341]|uniref:hypothetical protein n=1 Tax=Tenacibaculum sp. M341 TaxID=2530339 RepID=UPI0010458560|nr:hypothetical protein [Tenacibaculum sp. M341]TCI93552.1 hypothetical protein EYW44_03855 [Tenacibaculum sp. M341]